MKFRTFVADALVAGFLLAGVSAFVHAQEHPGSGDYDAHHVWHSDSWWYEHHHHCMIATGGKPTTLNGRMIITPTGSSV